VSGRLVISFDCEGNWGIADFGVKELSDSGLTDETLRKIYAHTLATLKKHDLNCTFALVGLFVAGPSSASRFADETIGVEPYDKWLRTFRSCLSQGNTSGWFMPELPQKLLESGGHELASHGYSHLPLLSDGVTEKVATQELLQQRQLFEALGQPLSSMVFPRNLIAYDDLLPDFGIDKWRGTKFGGRSLANRARGLLSELNVCAKSEAYDVGNREIPAGYFLNWKAGVRRLVAQRVTLQRWSHILESAARDDRVAHLWLHPENLAAGSSQVSLFEEAIEMAAAQVRRRRLRPCTFTQLFEGVKL